MELVVGLTNFPTATPNKHISVLDSLGNTLDITTPAYRILHTTSMSLPLFGKRKDLHDTG